ncbi:glycoside hydrolase family 28 protein [Novosphingobium resinovorum]|uniref:glycoside hydrolase family 28 protein n=1 Tax=Novosphingobium resinovorum TaxID=158500 RepID=UPI002ED5CC0A|nr:glycosyl hydrolase family 28 protein [Novosphingobium resinovorum]
MACHTRRSLALLLLTVPLGASLRASLALAAPRSARRVPITRSGAVADGRTINTAAIQRTIDEVARLGGGTVVVPAGVFVSGALFLKPGVDLHLERDAVLRCTTQMENFPPRRTRIEGHFEEHFTPALLNAANCDGLKITGEGTLDGAGRPIWDMFWKLRNAAPVPDEFPNLSIPRARLALIEGSRNVTIEGVTFRDSQFWNLHLYDCEDVLVRAARFEVPDDYAQAPSTDGVDVDSCRRVTIEGCYFSVTDDCVAAKGSKGPQALEDASSPPVDGLHIRDCHFRRGHHALACGSEATIVRNVTMERCRVTGDMVLLRLKLRPDTPQDYRGIALRDIVLDSGGGTIVSIEPWSQYARPSDDAPPRSQVDAIALERITGRFGAFGTIRPNPGQTRIGTVVLRDFDVRLADPELHATGVDDLRRVRVTARPVDAG